MAKGNKHDLPEIMPYQKTSSYGPAQFNHLRSPAQKTPKELDWGCGSFHKDGRARSSLSDSHVGYDKAETKR